MKVLFDVGHPAHVHYFKNLIHSLVGKNEVIVTCRESKIVQDLLTRYEIPYRIIGLKGSSIFGKAKKQIYFANKLRDLINKENIDVAAGASGAAVHGALFTRAKSILFDDDDQCVQPLMSKFITPFADVKLSPDALSFEKLPRAIYYPGYHELAYLHPNRFTPNLEVLHKYGLKEQDKYYILRFNAFKAHHDVNEGGMNLHQKRRLVHLLSLYGRVFITTEDQIDDEFKDHKMKIAPEDMHHFLAFAELLVSDSQTMSSEAAVLGTPAFRCNTFAGRLAVLEEEEKRYGLTKAFLPRQFDWMIENINQHIQNNTLKVDWHIKRQKLLQDKIDVTSFWEWVIINFPSSISECKSPLFNYDGFR